MFQAAIAEASDPVEPCGPQTYRLRRFGPAVLGAGSALFSILSVSLGLLLGDLFGLLLGLGLGLYAISRIVRVVGPNELRVDATGLQFSRGLIRTRVRWRSVAAINERTELPQNGTGNVGTLLIGGLGQAMGLSQTVIVVSLKPSEVADVGGPGLPVSRLMRRFLGSSNDLALNTAEFSRGMADQIFPAMHQCWIESGRRS